MHTLSFLLIQILLYQNILRLIFSKRKIKILFCFSVLSQNSAGLPFMFYEKHPCAEQKGDRAYKVCLYYPISCL